MFLFFFSRLVFFDLQSDSIGVACGWVWNLALFPHMTAWSTTVASTLKQSLQNSFGNHDGVWVGITERVLVRHRSWCSYSNCEEKSKNHPHSHRRCLSCATMRFFMVGPSGDGWYLLSWSILPDMGCIYTVTDSRKGPMCLFCFKGMFVLEMNIMFLTWTH